MSDSHGNATREQEPKTPMWLTALGGALFLLAGLFWALHAPSAENADGAAPAGSATADAGAPQH